MQDPAPRPQSPSSPLRAAARTPAGPDLDPELQPRARRQRAQSPGLPITCTSTRNDREPTIGNRSATRREPFLPFPHGLAGGTGA